MTCRILRAEDDRRLRILGERVRVRVIDRVRVRVRF
jgi:hypothetical protein